EDHVDLGGVTEVLGEKHSGGVGPRQLNREVPGRIGRADHLEGEHAGRCSLARGDPLGEVGGVILGKRRNFRTVCHPAPRLLLALLLYRVLGPPPDVTDKVLLQVSAPIRSTTFSSPPARSRCSSRST